ncbi:WD40 repeat domain-containing protein [Deinococcus radiophilus]|uniref:WD40 repeat domain-containing protein n=1 Tax=Deinococcus radiophilus TaxID=32062 RepID=A0A431VQC8_9DEIO|nr:WD40 repeat domain-containing protein [Deinococcus radiophilus]RTR25337.1 WD40 repeat domain-containing protein [Deinococcus radiophilus]UFA50479.1 WD40 repeat domain-containing protein [Deinococcus radiophilus]
MRILFLPLLTLLLCASASAQLRADIQKDTPVGQATMRVYGGEQLLFQATTSGLNAVTESKFSPDGKWLLNIADGSGYVQLWDVEKGERVKTFLSQSSRIFGADFTPDGQRLLLDFSGSKGMADSRRPGYLPSPTLWNLATLERIAFVYNDKRESFYDGKVTFSTNGERMAFIRQSSHSYGPVSVWNAKTGAHIATISRLPYPQGAAQTGGAGSVDARLSPDGRRVLVQYVDSRLAEYDAGTGTRLKLRGEFSAADAGAALEQFAREGR